MSNNNEAWAIEDHICRKCGGRILRRVTGGGATPGGNPVFRCASCGTQKSGMGPGVLCCCCPDDWPEGVGLIYCALRPEIERRVASGRWWDVSDEFDFLVNGGVGVVVRAS